MEEKYSQLEDENASDASEKSKTGQGTPEKKVVAESKKETEPVSTPTSAPSASKVDLKEDEDQDSDHEDPHGTCFIASSIIWLCCGRSCLGSIKSTESCSTRSFTRPKNYLLTIGYIWIVFANIFILYHCVTSI